MINATYTAAHIGGASVMLWKSAAANAATAELSYGLHGKLYLSRSGYLLLQVPNALGIGAFKALHEPGIELPGGDAGRYNAHVSVLRPEEVAQVGGATAIKERGQDFAYTLGAVRTVVPFGWDSMSRVWFIEIRSPELEAFRRSLGLAALPTKDDKEFPFHLTFAVRRKNILKANDLAVNRQGSSIHRLADQAQKAAALPYRDRVEMYGLNPQGKILGGYYNNDKNHGVFGGGVEPGESLEQAGAREFVEEAGHRLHNPQMLPVNPVTFDWTGPPSTDKLKLREQYRGSRTFFGTGEVGEPVSDEERGPDTRNGLQNIRFRSLQTALRRTVAKRGMNPEATKQRRAVLRLLLALQAQKAAAVNNYQTSGDLNKPRRSVTPPDDEQAVYGNLDKLQPGQLLQRVVQRHMAMRAGPHYDVRLGSPELGLYSWATKAEDPKPGEKRYMTQMPLHRYGWKDYEGEIPKGKYGAGRVEKHKEDQVTVSKAGPQGVHFTTADGQRYALVPMGGRGRGWMLINAAQQATKAAGLTNGEPSFFLNAAKQHLNNIFARPQTTFSPEKGLQTQGLWDSSKSIMENLGGHFFAIKNRGQQAMNSMDAVRRINFMTQRMNQEQMMRNALQQWRRGGPYDPASRTWAQAMRGALDRSTNNAMADLATQDTLNYMQTGREAIMNSPVDKMIYRGQVPVGDLLLG